MVFSSSLFLLYFLPATLIVYHLLPHAWRNVFLLLASVAFYAYGAPWFVFVVLGSITVNFFLVRGVFRSELDQRKRWYLWASILLNVGLLLYFKYANFFIENVNALLLQMGFTAVGWTRVVLPIGISFFTFQSLTYTVDVYRGERTPLKRLPDYMMYIMLFPQMIAGPIVRFSTIAHEIEDRRHNETLALKLEGFIRFSVGLAKKVLLANSLGAYADEVFAAGPANIDSSMAWLGIIAYSFQIYYDFSGYSDMAIGIGKILGFSFPENFNAPYIARNISEFWRRWHITLSTWMRDYLYIPLGGNRVNSQSRLFFNLWVVFLISGLWHGANWTFVAWGAYHGTFLVLDKVFYKKLSGKMPALLSIPLNYIVVLVSWVVFRSPDIGFATDYVGKMFSFQFVDNPYYYDRELHLSILAAAFFAFLPVTRPGKQWMDRTFDRPYTLGRTVWMSLACFLFVILSIGSVASSGFNPFIYFLF
jgi:alginate O-acetyltransferase complex protein AlgI